AQAAAEKVGVHLQPVMVNDPEGFEEAFASIRGRAEALWVQPIFNTKSVQKIHDLALRERLPTVSSFPLFAQTGLMLSYGPNHLALPRRAAVYVDKILKGAKPADLPVEQPTKLELVINLKDRQGARPDDPTVGTGASGSDHRVRDGVESPRTKMSRRTAMYSCSRPTSQCR